jgi:hypothetical protein
MQHWIVDFILSMSVSVATMLMISCIMRTYYRAIELKILVSTEAEYLLMSHPSSIA